MLYWKYFLYGQTNRITLVEPLQIEYALGFAKNVFVPVSLGGCTGSTIPPILSANLLAILKAIYSDFRLMSSTNA